MDHLLQEETNQYFCSNISMERAACTGIMVNSGRKKRVGKPSLNSNHGYFHSLHTNHLRKLVNPFSSYGSGLDNSRSDRVF